MILQLSNQTLKIKRDYEALVDVLQNIGGFAEILIFFFCYSMVYHHDVLMNLFLLNNSILMNEYNQSKKNGKLNQVIPLKENFEGSKYDRLPYTYWEVVWLKFFSCFCKNRERVT